MIFTLERTAWLRYTVALCSIGVCASQLFADEFVLANGATLSGKWLNRKRLAADPYVLQTEEGATLTLDRNQVREAHRSRTEDVNYQRIAPTYADTAESQWKLAEWCREHRLINERKVHLARVLKLDPNHHEARYASGYRFIRGKWMTVEEFRRSRGYERFDGEWRLQQEIELVETHRVRTKAEREWGVQLRRLRADLETKRANEAAAQIIAVRDKHAVSTLKDLLLKEQLRAAKMLYIEALAEMKTTPSIGALVVSTLTDSDEEVFYRAVRKIVESGHPELVDVYATTLHNPSNVRVNRAAIVLEKLGDRTAIEPLIEALTTKHTVTVGAKKNLSGDSYSASFGKDGNPGGLGGFDGNSFSAGDGSKTHTFLVNNQSVLTALVTISDGVNYGFDKRAWRHWLSTERRKLPNLQIRRDDKQHDRASTLTSTSVSG